MTFATSGRVCSQRPAAGCLPWTPMPHTHVGAPRSTWRYSSPASFAGHQPPKAPVSGPPISRQSAAASWFELAVRAPSGSVPSARPSGRASDAAASAPIVPAPEVPPASSSSSSSLARAEVSMLSALQLCSMPLRPSPKWPSCLCSLATCFHAFARFESSWRLTIERIPQNSSIPFSSPFFAPFSSSPPFSFFSAAFSSSVAFFSSWTNASTMHIVRRTSGCRHPRLFSSSLSILSRTSISFSILADLRSACVSRMRVAPPFSSFSLRCSAQAWMSASTASLQSATARHCAAMRCSREVSLFTWSGQLAV
mmetsp:Transcript_70220/g.184060  ORF Transcript_70220/g.184060 Transcript_70220/m.184060 type:complete len:310 (+) Transcript_70220:1557-2486(+)